MKYVIEVLQIMLYLHAAMYAEVIFVEHLDKLDDLELPRPVKRGSGHLITMFVDLEVS